MLFAIDLDGTIAGKLLYSSYIEYHNRDLALGIAPEVLASLPDYKSFVKLPEVQAFRRKQEERFQASRESARVSPNILLSIEALPDAIVGVHTLFGIGAVRYYTIRLNQEATKQWLTLKQFPSPTDVVFCEGTVRKLYAAYAETHMEIVLIDDRLDTLLQGFEEITKNEPEMADNLRRRLTIVAFGIETVPEYFHGLRLLALPSWKDVETLIASLYI